MKYRDILGYEKEKTPTKKQPKKNQIVEGIKKDLNEWNDTTFKDKPKRWSNSSGLTEYEQDLKEVSAAAEYRPHIKKIDKYYDLYWKSVQDFGKVLEKKGMKKESKFMHQKYYKHVVEFKAWFATFIKELL